MAGKFKKENYEKKILVINLKSFYINKQNNCDSTDNINYFHYELTEIYTKHF